MTSLATQRRSQEISTRLVEGFAQLAQLPQASKQAQLDTLVQIAASSYTKKECAADCKSLFQAAKTINGPAVILAGKNMVEKFSDLTTHHAMVFLIRRQHEGKFKPKTRLFGVRPSRHASISDIAPAVTACGKIEPHWVALHASQQKIMQSCEWMSANPALTSVGILLGAVAIGTLGFRTMRGALLGGAACCGYACLGDDPNTSPRLAMTVLTPRELSGVSGVLSGEVCYLDGKVVIGINERVLLTNSETESLQQRVAMLVNELFAKGDRVVQNCRITANDIVIKTRRDM